MPRTRFLPLLSVAWFLAVLLGFHATYPHGGLPLLLLRIIMLVSLAVAAWGLGRTLLRPLGLQDLSPGEFPLFEIGAGLGGIALLMLAVSTAGVLYRPLVLALLAGCVFLARGVDPRRGGTTAWSRSEILLALVAGCAGLVTLVGSLAPPEFYDALIYHLAVPDLYIRNHGMVEVPGNYYSHFPANMGMLYTAGLLIGGGEMAQSIHWLCGALAAASLFVTARRHTDRATALLATVLFSLTPGIMLVSTYAIADLGVTLFGVLCFAAALNFRRDGDRRWVVLAGLFAGLALGTKYTAAIVVCLPAGAAIAWMAGPGPRRRLTSLAIFGGIALLVMSPWLGRNAALTGNPVAPYLSSGSSPGIGDEIDRRLPESRGFSGLAAHIATAPWTVSTRPLGAGVSLGPVFLMLAPLLLLVRTEHRVVVPVAIMAGVGFLGWASTIQLTRYMMPIVPLLAILAAVAARSVWRPAAVVGIGWALLYNSFLFFSLTESIGTYRVVFGAERREQYLSRRVSYYPAAVFLGELPADQPVKVLFVGEGRGYYCPREYVASTPYDAPILDRYAEAAGGEEGLVRDLRADGFTHLLVSDPELRRTREIGADDVMVRFFPSGSRPLLFEGNGVRIYGL